VHLLFLLTVRWGTAVSLREWPAASVVRLRREHIATRPERTETEGTKSVQSPDSVHEVKA
jgi:hypothetical protein